MNTSTSVKSVAAPKQGMFAAADGKSLFITFALVSSLFLLWGFCNGMIDVMDKHFQKELHLTLAQSAWVQFAHYLGYFLMAMPAGWLASKLGYKGGIIAGLLMVAVGGFWFIPATKIATFPAFLLGVCVIASGLTFLETVANPYTTVLGPKQFAASRINLAQSCNGIGWILGPIAGGMFFYGQDASGASTGSQTLWIPYAAVGGFVLLLAIIFSFSKLPDIQSADEFHIDDSDKAVAYAPLQNRGIAMVMLWANLAVLSLAVGMIVSAVVAIPSVGAKLGITDNQAMLYASGALLAIGSLVFLANNKKLTNHSIWSHPHFSCGTLAQFFYVAAQCGVFAYFINYMTSQVPSVPEAWQSGKGAAWIEVQTSFSTKDFQKLPEFVNRVKAQADPVSTYIYTGLSKDTIKRLDQTAEGDADVLKNALARDLNQIVKQSASEEPGKELLYTPQRFASVRLSEKSQALIKDMEAKKEFSLPKLNRYLLSDTYPGLIAFSDSTLTFSDKGASFLASLGFFCFLAGRFIGVWLMKKFSAHKVLATFAALAGSCCVLIFMKLGWVSAVALFLTYFFMSIMFPTIFSLGIHGLGARAKKASSFIVMAIMGGAIMPKFMGHIGDLHGMSTAFIIPMFCFGFVAFYSLAWPKLANSTGLHGVDPTRGH
ncbi:MAG: MFS transporter [Verrucomicrobiota bacterium]